MRVDIEVASKSAGRDRDAASRFPKLHGKTKQNKTNPPTGIVNGAVIGRRGPIANRQQWRTK